MKRAMLLVLILAALILPCCLFGLFAYQENITITIARDTPVNQSDILIADNDDAKATKTTTESQ